MHALWAMQYKTCALQYVWATAAISRSGEASAGLAIVSALLFTMMSPSAAEVQAGALCGVVGGTKLRWRHGGRDREINRKIQGAAVRPPAATARSATICKLLPALPPAVPSFELTGKYR